MNRSLGIPGNPAEFCWDPGDLVQVVRLRTFRHRSPRKKVGGTPCPPGGLVRRRVRLDGRSGYDVRLGKWSGLERSGTASEGWWEEGRALFGVPGGESSESCVGDEGAARSSEEDGGGVGLRVGAAEAVGRRRRMVARTGSGERFLEKRMPKRRFGREECDGDGVGYGRGT